MIKSIICALGLDGVRSLIENGVGEIGGATRREVVENARDQLSSQFLTTGTPNISGRGAFAEEHLRWPDRYPNVLYQELKTVPE
jgi:hypothetical protein